jgi:hypothetical protein
MSNPIERRIHENRYERAVESCARVLDAVGVPEGRRRFIALREVEDIWHRYLSKLRDGGDGRRQWPAEQIANVRRHVDDLRDRASETTVVWLALVNGAPVGAEVPADTLLGASLDYLVSRASDLMLTSRDVSDGVCIELNHVSTGDEHEIVGWGAFRP